MPEPMVVTFTVWNRPHYLRQVLDAWSAVRGIGDAVLEFHCEPGCDEAVDLCLGVGFAERHVTGQQGAARGGGEHEGGPGFRLRPVGLRHPRRRRLRALR